MYMYKFIKYIKIIYVNNYIIIILLITDTYIT